MTHPRKKLIEIALPLEAINKESAREKSIRHGHPSTLHLWWARRPLAACRSVLFASLVDDPSSCPEEFPTEAEQEAERLRLFDIIEDLVKWENSNDEAVLQRARTEIARSTARTHGVSLPQSLSPNEVTEVLKKYAPPVLDPFAGGGSIPLEAQRLGLEAHASDLNPVAVLINKALIEIPPKFANRPPVHPEENKTLLQHEWRGAQGLAEDVRYYGKWMRDEAWKRIGHLYPKLTLPKEQGGGETTVIAWLWARTVTCPNPACAAQMPLVRSFTLSTKKDREVFAHPIIDDLTKAVRFEVRKGKDALEGTVNRAVARCLVCGHNAPAAYVRAEADARHMGAILMAVVLDGSRSQGRIYRAPTDEDIGIATSAIPLLKQMEASHNGPFSLVPDEPCRGTFASNAQGGRYGFYTFSDYFTPRQLVTLITFVHLVRETRELVVSDIVYPGN